MVSYAEMSRKNPRELEKFIKQDIEFQSHKDMTPKNLGIFNGSIRLGYSDFIRAV